MQPGDDEPYLWTAFFKVDGDTVCPRSDRRTVLTTN